MFTPNTPATLIVFGASLLLLIVSISTPILRSIYFLSIDLSPSNSLSVVANRNVSDLNAVINFGLFGYCVRLASQVTCSSPRLGYTVDPSSLVSLPSNINFDFSGWLLKTLTYPLILHPIASGLGFLSAISGVVSHFREFSRSRSTSWLSSIATTVAFGSFAFDILVFSLAKSRINGTTNPNFSLNAKLGNAIWITLAAWISLTLSGCFFCAGRCIHSRRQRGQSQAHLIRPELDEDYNHKMREQAEKDEQNREKGSSTHSNLPAFAEHAVHDDRNQEHIPLNSFQPEDQEAYAPHARHAEPREVETLAGVGAGYGRRQRQGLVHQPSGMSQATLYSHASRSQLPPMQPIPQPAQPYPRQFTSSLDPDVLLWPSNHNPSSTSSPGDLYKNLPAHVEPASNSMNQLHQSNSMNQLPHPNSMTQLHQTNSMNQSHQNNWANQSHPTESINQPHQTNSIAYRLPQSLIPASMPHWPGPLRSSYVSPPPSHTPVIQSQMHELPQSGDYSSFPSSQPTMTGLPYLQPQPNLSEPHQQLLNPEQYYTLDGPASTSPSRNLPPPTYQTNYSQADSNNPHLPHPTGSSEPWDANVLHGHEAPSQAAQQSTYELGSQARTAHLTEEAAAGLPYDRMNDSSRLLSSQFKDNEYDLQSGGDTDYTVTSFAPSSIEQTTVENQPSRRELPQVPQLPPLSFISPPSSPLHPPNNFNFAAH